jgi:hypothetical protein
MAESYFDIEARIQEALAVMKHEEKPNISRYARDFDVPRLRLSRRYHGSYSRSDRPATNRKLTTLEELVVIDYIKRIDRLFIPLIVRLIRLTADSVLRITHDGPPSEAPRVSHIWTARFLERHPTWYRRVAKPLEIDRKTAHSIEDISAWFELFQTTVKKYSILPSDLWNFDETGYNIGMAGETVVITEEPYQKQYTPSLEDRTRVSSIECINAARDYLLAFHILPGKCILGSWVEDLHDNNYIAVTDSGYSNNLIGFE